ncbi:SDR family oxidoreductase [Streptomyces sp. DSM 44917]|uniref:SDR family oxidoreductase n=1 Tax=Streptomyces boetiae TaxID=3075541 RepID=A0ABU2L1Y1_9ACTN|nr:SDR family oxidoreductase [Streptomyces sp. DSM 44917]MDT0305353.1 SDR family oxidoreductase [Streptomyces sp. DSM 44917]
MTGALEGKAAVVTGGSRGIGRAIVERLVRDGARVVFSHASAAGPGAAPGGARGVRADFTDPAAAERLMAEAEKLLGGLDVLVNNVALVSGPTPLAETTEEEFERVLGGNAKAAFLTMRYAARHMSDGGRIVNISSMNTVRPAPGFALYGASKGALEQLSAVAAEELGPRGITVNVVSPGATDTELLRGANAPEALEQVPALTPLGRLGQPSDIADVVAFLAGPDGRWITGQNIRATGGLA